MSYLALARRYRPQTFADVVGQEAVVQTLANALTVGRVAQAYLLAGPRGVGKTTLARILAMALNCSQRRKAADPCGACDPCRQTAQGEDLDVLEIDGASHNGVEAIRTICANVLTLPARGKYRVYIIDEVHMLSASAFNALLKTLEEPPPHAMFIFATTHPHKILPTILSRCQRFDLRRIAPEQIAARLAEVCRQEKLAASPAALAQIAARAEGGLRDALTLLDQARALKGAGQLEPRDVRAMLGLAESEEIDALLLDFTRGDVGAVLARLAEVWSAGKDLESFARQILEYSLERVGQASPGERTALVRLGSALLAVWPQLSPSRAGRTAFEWAFLEAFVSGAPPARAGVPPEPFVEKRRDEARSTSSSLASATALASSSGAAPSLTLEEVNARWPEFLARVKKENRAAGAFLAEASCISAGGGMFEIQFPFEGKFHCDGVEQPAHRASIENCFKDVYGVSSRMKTRLAASAEAAPEAAGNARSEAPVDPILKKAADIFQGRVVTHRKEARK